MSNCKTLKEIADAIIKDGKSADDVIPLDIHLFNKECVIELLYLYIKYGKDEQRIHACMEKLEELTR